MLENVFMPLTVKVRSAEELEAEDCAEAQALEAEKEPQQNVRVIKPAAEEEAPNGLDPAIPLHAMHFEEATPVEVIEQIETTDQTNNGDTN